MNTFDLEVKIREYGLLNFEVGVIFGLQTATNQKTVDRVLNEIDYIKRRSKSLQEITEMIY